jgi:organic radical activating enzyme
MVEDFVNYKKPSLFIGTCFCDWKCCKEQNLDVGVCQNAPLAKYPLLDVANVVIYEMFSRNKITKAVVIGGLEPMLQIDEVVSLIDFFRDNDEMCPFVIYTGYYPHEIENQLESLKRFPNIIVKYGRYIPDDDEKYDEVLGVTLASSNQYAEVLS